MNYQSDIVLFLDFFDPHSDDSSAAKEVIHAPIILWWTGFTAEPGKYDWCGKDQCFFTIDKHYYHHPQTKVSNFSGLFLAILEKGPWPKLEEMIDLTSKLGEINDIEHNKGSKIYPQNQVNLVCIMSSIPLKHKHLSIILIWVIVSHK